MSTVGDRREAPSRDRVDALVVEAIGDDTLAFIDLVQAVHPRLGTTSEEATKNLLRDAIWRLADHGVIDIDWDRRLKRATR